MNLRLFSNQHLDNRASFVPLSMTMLKNYLRLYLNFIASLTSHSFIYRLFVFAVSLIAVLQATATHNRAGEITYEHLEGFRYRVTIRTCTDISDPNNADREWMPIDWGHVIGPGENTQDSIQRTTFSFVVEGVTKENIYTVEHTFPGSGSYCMVSEDPNRNAGVNNIAGSIDVIFSITTCLEIYPGAVINSNNSVELLNAPKDDGCVNQVWTHGVAAFDPDGDSLAFELIPCTGAGGLPINNYLFPDEFQPPNGAISFDQQFGIVTWDSPMITGLYNIAIRISEYRRIPETGLVFFMGSVVRDMQIEITNCPNQAPVINPITDVCVVAGELMNVEFTASDPDGTIINLEATGEIFTESNASFTPLGANEAAIQWVPECDDVRQLPYLVFLRAEDDAGLPPLSANDGFTIQVIAPPVQGLALETGTSGGITVNWDSYECENATGFKIYRRQGSNDYEPGECETGINPDSGYELIGSVSGAGTTEFTDTKVPVGSDICYRIVACFADGSESIVSDEACEFLDLVIPAITHNSIGATDTEQGIDTLRWAAPLELDTLLTFPGPYFYRIYHSTEDDPESLEFLSETPETAVLNSQGLEEFIHTGIDTEALTHYYRVELYSQDAFAVSSVTAASHFLNVEPSNESLLLSWEVDVPWSISEYEIFEIIPGSDPVLVGSTVEREFLIEGLENNVEHCYVVRSTGGYEIPGLEGPYYSFSQEVCSSAFDNVPPCSPSLELSGDCEESTYQLSWANSNEACNDDIAGYIIYYSPILGEPLQEFATVDGPLDTVLISFEGDLYGCFAVAAFDSLSLRPDGSLGNNLSVLSDSLCIPSCPSYELPNVFSPNNDGVNDTLTPFRPYSYVDSVEFMLYNRWGNIVFETTDPDILWTGENQDSGELVSDGVYYYTIVIFQLDLTGILPRETAGTIQVFGNRNSSAE